MLIYLFLLNLADAANMHHMILSALGDAGNKKLLDSSSEDSLMKKLMDGNMVVSDDEGNKSATNDQGLNLTYQFYIEFHWLISNRYNKTLLNE